MGIGVIRQGKGEGRGKREGGERGTAEGGGVFKKRFFLILFSFNF